MRFEFYTEMTVAQCVSALNERIHAKATASRPGVDGWIEKGGRFSLAVTTPVARRFRRTTRLQGQFERESGITVVRGAVPDGMEPRRLLAVFVAMLVVGVVFTVNEQFIFGLLCVLMGAGLCITLYGDFVNHDILIRDLRRTLKARDKRPKK